MADICRKAGISQAADVNWTQRYDGLLPTEMRRLKLLEDENAKRRKLVVDLSPVVGPGDAAGRHPAKTVKPARKRKLVDGMRGEWGVSIRRACRVLEVDTSAYHYEARRHDQAGLEARIKDICATCNHSAAMSHRWSC